jgi:hypothetical protein
VSSNTEAGNISSTGKGEGNRYPLEMKAYAKMLYLLVDKNTGEKQFNNIEIIEKLKVQFGDSPAPSTFSNWAREWQNELELRETVIGSGCNELNRYHFETKEFIDRDKIVKAVFDHIKMSIVLHSRRMHKYGDLENNYLSSLLEAEAGSATKKKLIENLLKDNPEAKRINRILTNFKLVDIQRGVVDSNRTFITLLEKLEKWLKLEEDRCKAVVEEGKKDDVWEFEPVDIEEFLEGEEFLGETIYPTLFECVKEDVKNIFYGNPRKILERRRYKEILFKEAYGTGKSIRAALIACYLTYLILCLRNPAKYFKLMQGSKITITNVAVTKKQAKDVVFFKAKSMIDYCPWFRNHGYMYDPNNKLELRFDPADATRIDPTKIYKNVYITPGSSSEFSAVGYDVICAVIDEATAYGIEADKDKAEIIYDTFKGRVASRFDKSGMIVMAGNPHHVDDFLERRLKEAKDDKEIYIVKQRSLWEAKMPHYDGDWFYFDYGKMKIVDEAERDKENVLKIPITFQNEFETSPEASTRNIAGISLESISRFITNIDKIDEMFIKSGRKNLAEVMEDGTVKFAKNFKPVNNGVHAVHVDIGVTGDPCGIALGHISDFYKGNPTFFVDCLIGLKGSKSNPNILEDIRGIIYQLSQLGFNIGPVSLDGYQSTDFIQIMNRKGYDSYLLSVDRNMTPYINMRQALYEGRINCPFHDVLKYELKTLENVNDKKVDHPLKGTKDVSDALCGMINSLIEKVPIESITSDRKFKKKSIVEAKEKEKKARTPDEIFDDMISDAEKGTENGIY